MTNAIISDITGKTIKMDSSYKVSIYSRGQKVHLDFDCEFVAELQTLCKLALKNGAKWYQLIKSDDGKWSRKEVEVAKKNAD